MKDKKFIISGVIVFLIIATFPFWYMRGKAAPAPEKKAEPAPAPKAAEEDKAKAAEDAKAKAEADAKADAMKKLAPRALWWFRWGAALTWLSGALYLYMLGILHHAFTLGLTEGGNSSHMLIGVGAWLGTIMLFNVWVLIWPNQKKILGIVDASADQIAAAKKVALMASRTNTLFSGPMLFGMLGSKHLYIDASATALYVSLAIIAALEVNALFGKTGPMTSVVGVIHCSIAMAAIIWAFLAFL